MTSCQRDLTVFLVTLTISGLGWRVGSTIVSGHCQATFNPPGTDLMNSTSGRSSVKVTGAVDGECGSSRVA